LFCGWVGGVCKTIRAGIRCQGRVRLPFGDGVAAQHTAAAGKTGREGIGGAQRATARATLKKRGVFSGVCGGGRKECVSVREGECALIVCGGGGASLPLGRGEFEFWVLWVCVCVCV
jgi:hypothetical protein